MIIVGISGGIASGKSFVSKIFAKSGADLFDADKEVHQILASDKSAIKKISKIFPDSINNGIIDRKKLGNIVFNSKTKLNILEKIIHPIVRKRYKKFFLKSQKNKKNILVLDIPLLLERGGYDCDVVIALIVSKKIQETRFLQRQEKYEKISLFKKRFKQITKLQMDNASRRKLADFVINTSKPKGETRKAVKNIIKKLLK